VATDSPHNAAAFTLLGMIFILDGTLWCLGVAVFVAGAAGRIRKSGRAFAWVNRGLGGLFFYLGVRVAMTETR
jgi:threonine/homoserine/homoserine lactone efflux protein